LRALESNRHDAFTQSQRGGTIFAEHRQKAALERALSIRGGSGRSLQIATGTAWLYIPQKARIVRK
jgi:hypothetical protein